jgi:hypothetical protein
MPFIFDTLNGLFILSALVFAGGMAKASRDPELMKNTVHGRRMAKKAEQVSVDSPSARARSPRSASRAARRAANERRDRTPRVASSRVGSSPRVSSRPSPRRDALLHPSFSD